MSRVSDLLSKLFEGYALQCPPTFKLVGDKCVKMTAKEILTKRNSNKNKPKKDRNISKK
jgi:hypothetical protein